MNKFLNSVALINLYSSWCKLYSSILYSSMLKAIFERTKVFKFCWVIYTRVFLRILLHSVVVFFFDRKTSFLIVNAPFPFRFNVLRHHPCQDYICMLKSNQSPKLVILLLLCKLCKHEYYSKFDYPRFAIFCFLYITFRFGDLCIVAK